jgi:hypothetical protein
MVLTGIGNKALYPDFVGRRALFVGSGPGPTAYSQTAGDVLSLNLPNYYIDAPCGTVQSLSGTYYVVPRPVAIGARGGWSLYWYVTSSNAPVGANVNLSAETVQLGVICGQF